MIWFGKKKRDRERWSSKGWILQAKTTIYLKNFSFQRQCLEDNFSPNLPYKENPNQLISWFRRISYLHVACFKELAYFHFHLICVLQTLHRNVVLMVPALHRRARLRAFSNLPRSPEPRLGLAPMSSENHTHHSFSRKNTCCLLKPTLK